MTAVIIIIAVILVIYFGKKSSDKNKVASGELDNTIATLGNYYSITRSNLEGLGCGGVISISTYWFELNGSVSSSSAYMSVCVTEGTNDNLARSLGMDVKTMNNKKYYQFIVKRPCNRTVKREIVKKLSGILSAQYPNDVIKVDESIPALFSMVDSRDIMEMLGHQR